MPAPPSRRDPRTTRNLIAGALFTLTLAALSVASWWVYMGQDGWLQQASAASHDAGGASSSAAEASPGDLEAELAGAPPRAVRLLHYDPAPQLARAALDAPPRVVGARGVAGGAPLYVMVGAPDARRGSSGEEQATMFRVLRHAHGWESVRAVTPPPGTWGELSDGVVGALGGRVPDVLLLVDGVATLGGLRGERAASPLAATRILLFINPPPLGLESESTPALAAALAAADLVASTHDITAAYSAKGAPHVWVPHAASPQYRLPMRPAADVVRRVLLSPVSDGTAPHLRTFRALVESRLRAGDDRFVAVKAAGALAGESALASASLSAARALNTHLACIADGTPANTSVAKLFEIPAAGCLLLLNAEVAPVMARLGFVPLVHYVPYTAKTLNAAVDAVLDASNAEAVDTIRRQGQALVWARHTVAHRASSLHALALRLAGTES
jgi:hypothetical protein